MVKYGHFYFYLVFSTGFIHFFFMGMFSLVLFHSLLYKTQKETGLNIQDRYTLTARNSIPASWTRELDEYRSSKEVKFVNCSQTKLAIENPTVLYRSVSLHPSHGGLWKYHRETIYLLLILAGESAVMAHFKVKCC